jgi:hypothetical protein
MGIVYWGVFALTVLIWFVWAYVVFFGGVGYTRNSTESTPTGEDGRH